MAYNPFNAASGIVENKRKWANAKAKGEDTTPYEEGAAAYYKELRDNGRGDVADYLQKSDSITAGEYLKTLTPDYQATAGDLQSKSNEAYKWITDTANQLDKDYDMVYQTIGVTPTRTDYGKDILSGYGIAADAAYKSSLGGGAENNGGNVDSYAAAQANRNKAAMVKEGYGTVLDYYNSIAGNATKWAGDKANALGGFAGLMQGNVTDDRDTVEKAYDGSIKLFQTQDTNKTNKEIADTEAELAREKMAQEKLIADEKNAVELMLQQMKSTYKGATGNAPDPMSSMSDIVDKIMDRYTKDSYAVSEDTIDGKKYVKNGKEVAIDKVKAELQSMLNSAALSDSEKAGLYKEAITQGITGLEIPQASAGNDGNEGLGITPEPIVSSRYLNTIDEGIKTKHTPQEKVNYLLNVGNNLGLTDGNLAWLLDRYNLNIN